MHLGNGYNKLLLRFSGFSLTELMVVIAIGSFIALAGSTFYVTTVGSGKDIFDSARRTEQVFAPVTSLLADIRRSGFRGTPSSLASYLVTTGGSGASTAGDEGDFPAIEFAAGVPSVVGSSGATGCVLVTYVRDHTCVSGDASNFTGCASVGTVVSLHYRFGYRLQAHVLEATALVHPDEYLPGGATPSNSECNASGASSAWVPVTKLADVFVDTFTVELVDQDSADGDNGCILSTAGSAPCDTYGNIGVAQCGTTSLSCRIDRLYKVTLCAYSGSTDGLCSSNPDNKIYAELFAKPRNSVLIQKASS